MNPDIANRLSLPSHKTLNKHAFLPPAMEAEPLLLPLVNDRIQTCRQNGRIIICANASRLDVHNNQDLYGLDLSIEVTNRLVKKGYAICFIYTVSSIDKCEDAFNKSLELVQQLNLNNNFLLINETLSFVRLIEKADIILRPTNTDGDALTIREALYFNKKVLASDVTTRPEGTILFKTRDIDDLELKLENIIKQVKPGFSTPAEATGKPDGNFKAFYIDLIKNIALK